MASLQKSRSEEIPRQRRRAEAFREAKTRFRLESAHGGWEGSSHLQVGCRLSQVLLDRCWKQRLSSGRRYYAAISTISMQMFLCAG